MFDFYMTSARSQQLNLFLTANGQYIAFLNVIKRERNDLAREAP